MNARREIRIGSSLFAVLVIGLTLIWVSNTVAAETDAVARYFDDETILVAHVDLARIDPEKFMQFVADVSQLPPEQRAELEASANIARQWIQAFRAAGGQHLFGVLSLRDVPQGGPFVIATVAEGGDAQTLAALLLSGRSDGTTEMPAHHAHVADFELAQPIDGVVFAGSRKTLARLQALRPVERPLLAAALAAAGDTDAQVAFSLGPDQRRVLREMMPSVAGLIPETKTMPVAVRPIVKTIKEALVPVDGKLLADAVQWAALGVNLPPNMSAELKIESNSAAAANTLHTALATAHGIGTELLPVIRQLAVVAQTQNDRVPPEAVQLFAVGESLLRELKPQLENERIVLRLADTEQINAAVELAKVPVQSARERATRSRRMNDFKQIALALHMYHDGKKVFPPVWNVDDDGKKLLSWRVHILPYIEQGELYKRFRLDEPWDSEHNRQLIDQMPPIFAADDSGLREKHLASCLAPVGESLAFTGGEGISYKAFTDGTSRTILLVDVDPSRAVVWTKPEDLKVDLDDPTGGLLSDGKKEFIAALADGSVHVFDQERMDAEKLRKLFTRNGGEVISW